MSTAAAYSVSGFSGYVKRMSTPSRFKTSAMTCPTFMAYSPVSGVARASLEVARFLADGGLARLAQHLVDLVDVRLLLRDETARVLLE